MSNLTEQAKVELLATKVIIWNDYGFEDVWFKGEKTPKNAISKKSFRPYQDWNHTHMVLDRICEDDEMFFCLKATMWEKMEYSDETLCFLKANQEQLMDAVISLITND